MEVNKLPILGQVIKRIAITDDKQSIFFFMQNGDLWEMTHDQECCEVVEIDDIEGEIYEIRYSTLTQAEEVINDNPEGYEDDSYYSHTWTFYKFANSNGYVTIKWHGKSNGYYSETVSFKLLGTLKH